MAVFATITNEIGARLGNRSDIGQRVVTWANDALFELAHNPRFSFRELDTSTTFTVPANITGLQLSSIAGNIWFILIIRTISHRWKQIHEEEMQDLISVGGTGEPDRYALFGGIISWYPGPTQAYNATILYRKRLTQLTTTDTIPLPREWEEPLVVLGTIKGLEALQRFEEAATHRQIYEGLLQQRMSHLELEEPQYETTIGVRYQ